jgi:hypothetical protein
LPWFAALFLRAFFFRDFLAMPDSVRDVFPAPMVVGVPGGAGLGRAQSMI